MQSAASGLRDVSSFHVELASSMATHSVAVGVVFVNIAGLFDANRTHGWAAGNALIETQARRLAQLAPVEFFHLAGHAFAGVVVSDRELVHGAMEPLLARIRRDLSRSVAYGDADLTTAATVFVATPEVGESPAAFASRVIARDYSQSWAGIHLRAREAFDGIHTRSELVAAIASAGVATLGMRAVVARIGDCQAVAGSQPDRPPDFVVCWGPVEVESWGQNADHRLYSSTLTDAIGAAVQARAEVIVSAERERDLGDVDPLTGLLNRRGFERRLAHLAMPCTIAVIDVDDMKIINDTLGHAAGDNALRHVANLLRSGRASDVVCRWGGEEFVVALDGDCDRAEHWLRRLITSAQTAPEDDFSFSAGVSQCLSIVDLDAAVARADNALYTAKRNGKAQVAIAT